MTDENQVASEEAQVEGQEQEQAPGLSLQDISAAVQIIDAVTPRGAFRGEELASVGMVRERFMAFLRHAKEQGQEVNLPGEAPSAPAEAPAEAQTIKLADLISNSRSIMEHDPAFARTYLEEKRMLLEVMTKGDPGLYAEASKYVGV